MGKRRLHGGPLLRAADPPDRQYRRPHAPALYNRRRIGKCPIGPRSSVGKGLQFSLRPDTLFPSRLVYYSLFATIRALGVCAAVESGFANFGPCGRPSSGGCPTSNGEKGAATAGSDRCFLLRDGFPRRIVQEHRQFFRRKSNIYCYSRPLE